MPEVLFILVILAMFVAESLLHREAVATERARVNELLTLLEAKAAPAEVAAYVTAPEYDAQDDGNWIFTDDGLVGAWVPPEGD